MSAVGSRGHQPHVPVSLDSHGEGAEEDTALKRHCSILCCVFGVLPCQDAPEHLVFDGYRCIFVLCRMGHFRLVLP